MRARTPGASTVGLAEEELQLALGGLGRVAAVHDVLGDDEPEVATDRPGRGGRRVRRPHHRAPDVDRALALQTGDDDRSRGDEVHQLAEERLLAMLAVVL